MTRTTWLAAVVGCGLAGGASAADPPKVRLFVLSGQSNMAGLNPDGSFTPAVKAAFPGDTVVVVKSAQSGQPIRRWVKGWKPPAGATVAGGPAKPGDLYDTLLAAVKKGLDGKTPDAVTFVWMQGERDAKENLSAVYEESLRALVGQVRADLGRADIGVVVGRLSDHLATDPWTAVRAAQVTFAAGDPRAAWVDTDDLNGPANGLHYTKDGYAELGKRFAAKAVELQKQSAK